jgi:hypothetical protein
VVGQHDQHAGQQGADGQLPGADPGGQEHLDPRRDAGAVGNVLQGRQRDHGRAAPEEPDRVGLGGGFQAGEIVAAVLRPGEEVPVVDRIPGDEESVRRLIGAGLCPRAWRSALRTPSTWLSQERARAYRCRRLTPGRS